MHGWIAFRLLVAAPSLWSLCKSERATGDVKLHDGTTNFPPECITALSNLQAELETATKGLMAGQMWKMVSDGEGDKSGWRTLCTGQTDLFHNWTGTPWSDRYKGDQDSFGGRARWFFLGSWEKAARYGCNSHYSLGCKKGYEKRRYPKGFFWDLVSPRVISYTWDRNLSPPKLLDGRDQEKYESVLTAQCKITLERKSNRHSIDKWKKSRKIIAAFMEAGIDGILESEFGVNGQFSQIVLFRPEKHLKWILTVPGKLDCEDDLGLHYRYSALDKDRGINAVGPQFVSNYPCDGGTGYYTGKRNFDGELTPTAAVFN
mmetsp:Transcript_123015/g.244841  ORF Transcript_123015/g.244841 Transcript_123015/m.244841 type:complete len:317 (+) Transcript_123015:64-1014(+)